MKRKKLKNGVDLMYCVFMKILQNATLHQVMFYDKDVIAQLKSGPNEGLTVRLYYEKQDIRIEFHTFLASAQDHDHQINNISTLSLGFLGTNITDQKQGKLLKQSFHATSKNLMRDTQLHITPYVTEFLSLLKALPNEYVWESEVAKSQSQEIFKDFKNMRKVLK